jgi:L-alanine-DL-glutamate epimerase-like enolase superfamily enzyme
MKVTKVRTVPVRVPLAESLGSALGAITSIGCLAVYVETDGGVVGEGLLFSLNGRHLKVFAEMIAALEDVVVGTDPTSSGEVVMRMWKAANFCGTKGVAVIGIGALDMALWDIRGKLSDLPIYRLVGAYRSSVPVYASGGLWLSQSVDELQRQAEELSRKGFRAMKMRLGAPTIDEDVERVRAVRQAIKPSVGLMVDANQRFSVNRAIQLGRKLEELDLLWFEEPVAAHDLRGSAAVASALDTPIASGESEYGQYGFRDMLECGSADILMPDLQRVGGATEFIRVAHMAAALDIDISSHLFSEFSLQMLGCVSNATFLEHMPWFSELYNEQIEFLDGRAIIPDRPGWGFSFNEKALKSYAIN